MKFYQTVITKPLTCGGLWSDYAVAAGNAVDDAIEDALHVLMGKHMKRMEIVSVTHTPLTLNNSVCLVVTVIAKEIVTRKRK